jgi:hypothetical protein
MAAGITLMAMKPLIFALCLVLACFGANAQKFIRQPSAGHKQVLIWPGAAPDQQPVKGPEYAVRSGKDFLVAGKPAIGVWDVSRPTMTVYSPKVRGYRRGGGRVPRRRL